MKHGHDAEAIAVISALDDKDWTDEDVQKTYHAIRESVAIEEFGNANPSKEKRSKSHLELLLTGGRSQNFRRAALGVVNQCFQQITGINLIT